MKTLTLYSVMEWDDCGGHNHKFFLSNKDEADKYKHYHVYVMVQERIFEIFDTVEEWEEWKTVEVKRRALSKLTAEERRVLGY